MLLSVTTGSLAYLIHLIQDFFTHRPSDSKEDVAIDTRTVAKVTFTFRATETEGN
jgi:hypothetical protein